MAISRRQTDETLRSDMWRACDILRRDNNVGGVMQYTEHLAWDYWASPEALKKWDVKALIQYVRCRLLPSPPPSRRAKPTW